MNPRILLIDDDLILGQMIRALVQGRGGHLTQAINGATGLEMTEANEYDHILVDILLPRLGGLDVLRNLKVRARSGRKARLTAISSQCQPEQVRACLDAGADHFLPKPVHPRALFDSLGL